MQGAHQSHQLRIALRGVNPPIWRGVQVRGDTPLRSLHPILKSAMGWTGTHLHEFRRSDGSSVTNESSALLSQIAQAEGSSFAYVYDFGDGWEHDVLVEKVLDAAEPLLHPICLAGERACPPEDCGGPTGYQDLLDALRDPDNPDHDEWLEWVGDGFDSEAFDIQAVNARLRQLPRR